MNWLESKLNDYNITRYRLSKETGVSEQYLKKIIDNDIPLMDLKHWQALAILDFFDKRKERKPDMTEVYLKLNEETCRFDCYNVLTDEYESTLSCGNSFIIIDDENDEEIAGRIECHNTNGYHWTGVDDTVVYLSNGIKGYI